MSMCVTIQFFYWIRIQIRNWQITENVTLEVQIQNHSTSTIERFSTFWNIRGLVCLLLILLFISSAATTDGQQRGAPRRHGNRRLEELLRKLLQWRPRRVT